MSLNTLSVKFHHPRDDHIQFFERGHKYVITTDPASRYTSVTTWVHTHFPKFDADKIIDGMMKKPDWKPGHKYWGMTKIDIKQSWSSNGEAVSSAGTRLHLAIEQFMNTANAHTHMDILDKYSDDGPADVLETVEWSYFLRFVKDRTMFIPYRTEWLIYDEDLKIAGSIDMVYSNEDGTLSIYDWKRCKSITKVNSYNKFATTICISHLHDTNFWHYTLQLNIYKYIIERKYGRVVSGLYLVQLHPEVEEETYVIHEVPNIHEMDELMADRETHIARLSKK